MNTILELPAPAPKPARTTRRKRILLVDEDSAVRQIVLRLLSEEGYSVVTAANDAEAFEITTLMRFDLVLLDLNTPARGGWEIFEQLYDRNPMLAIILITSRPSQFYSAVWAGALLEKPLDFTKLFFTIHTLLEEPAKARFAREPGRHPAQACNISPTI